MKKIDSLYHELLKKEILTSKEITQIAQKIIDKKNPTYRYIYNEYLTKLKTQNKLKSPKKGLYIAVPPTQINKQNYQPDKYLLASKLQHPYYLGYHSALELHGCAYSTYNTVTVVLPKNKKIRPFTYKKIHYQPIYSSTQNQDLEEILYKNQKIIISTPTQTFLDCIRRPDLAGGFEEVLKSLETLPAVNADQLKKLLNTTKRNDLLIRKTGLILDLFKDNPYYSSTVKKLRPYLQKNKGETPRYLKQKTKSIYNKEWNLYIPKGFTDLLRGI